MSKSYKMFCLFSLLLVFSFNSNASEIKEESEINERLSYLLIAGPSESQDRRNCLPYDKGYQNRR